VSSQRSWALSERITSPIISSVCVTMPGSVCRNHTSRGGITVCIEKSASKICLEKMQSASLEVFGSITSRLAVETVLASCTVLLLW
jgi:hypothetical protein